MDDKAFRSLMGQFATGITVVTTNVGGQLHGMTANAFTSLSLDPLLLLVCVVKGTTCHQQMQQATHFGINILSADQEDLSNTFAKSGDPENGSLRGASFELGLHDVPKINDSLAWVTCRKAEVLPGGDHDIFLGEALDGDTQEDASPLLFFRGGYQRIG